jgi:hypothetical protein
MPAHRSFADPTLTEAAAAAEGLEATGAFDPRSRHSSAGARPCRALTAPGAAWSRIVVTAAAVGTGLDDLDGTPPVARFSTARTEKYQPGVAFAHA